MYNPQNPEVLCDESQDSKGSKGSKDAPFVVIPHGIDNEAPPVIHRTISEGEFPFRKTNAERHKRHK